MTASVHHVDAEQERLVRQALRDALRKADAAQERAEAARAQEEEEARRLAALEATEDSSASSKKAANRVHARLKAAANAAAWGAEASLN